MKPSDLEKQWCEDLNKRGVFDVPTPPQIESFLMYINPDDRDMARGALEALLDKEREKTLKDIESALEDYFLRCSYPLPDPRLIMDYIRNH